MGPDFSLGHRCHAVNCTSPCLYANNLFCPDHWRRVPFSLQAQIYAASRRGQLETRSPLPLWVEKCKQAITYVARIEGVTLSRIEKEMKDWDGWAQEVVMKWKSPQVGEKVEAAS